MNQLQIFENPEFGAVRTVEIDGEPWLVGKDVAEALGYKNTKDAISSHVDEEDKRIVQRSEIATIENHIPKTALPINFVSGDIPNRGLTIINESGLYSLVLSSKLPTARKFKHWVTSEVLPSLRRHGLYAADELLNNPDLMIRAMEELKAERARANALAEKVERDAPKVLFAESVAASQHSILVFDLAKILRQNGVQIGGNRLFEWLRTNGYLIRRKGSDWNMPTQRAVEMGLFEIKETSVTHADGHVTVNKTPKVTGKGQQYFINLFLRKPVA